MMYSINQISTIIQKQRLLLLIKEIKRGYGLYTRIQKQRLLLLIWVYL